MSNIDQVNGPEWLTPIYMENVLQRFLKRKDIQVSSLSVKPFGAAGDGYASTMYRVAVVITGITEKGIRDYYILKMLPLSEIALEKLGKGNFNVQEKEMDMFQNIFPEFRNTLKSIDEARNIFPKAIAVDRIRDALLLEDLSLKGFIMAERKIGLDLDHLKISLKKLARFHAASMVAIENNPKMFENFKTGMISRGANAFHHFFSSNLELLTAEVLSWNDYAVYGEKLKKMKNFMYEKANNCFDNEPGDMKVLIHGDLWVNNLMFKYDKKGIVNDAIILDFQFCCIAHPAIDLFYFIYTSSTDEIRQTKFLYLTKYFYTELRSILQKLNYNLHAFPSLQNFQHQVIRKYFYAFPSLMIIFPLMINEDPDASFENVHQVTEKAWAFKQRLYKNPRVQKIIKNTLPMFDELGLLDED